MQGKENQEMNSGVKIVCGVLLVAVVTAAGVGLLVQHRKLDELRRARADQEASKRALVADHAELMSANEKLAGELRALRDAARARSAIEKDRESLEKNHAAIEQGRTACQKELDEVVKERERLKSDAALAQAAKARLEKEVSGLKASVKDLTASEKKLRGELSKLSNERDKLRGERDNFRKKCEALEHELNEAMQPALEEDAPAKDPVTIPVTPAPPLDKMTPEERAAHVQKEFNELDTLE